MRFRLTYSNVVGTLALFVALGGTSYAVVRLPANSVGSRQVRDHSLLASDLSASAVRGARGPRGAEGPAGPAGPQGAAGPVGPSQALVATPASIALSRNIAVPVEVASLKNVPAGSYLAVFTGDAELRVASAGLYVVCQIRVNGTPVSTTQAIVGDAYGGNEVMSDMVPIARTAPFDASVSCYPDQTTTGMPAGPTMNFQKLALIRVDRVTTG